MNKKERQERHRLVGAIYANDIIDGRVKNHNPKIPLFRKFPNGDETTRLKPRNLYTFRDHYTVYSGRPPWRHMSEKEREDEVNRHLRIYGNAAKWGAGLALAKLAYDGFKGALTS